MSDTPMNGKLDDMFTDKPKRKTKKRNDPRRTDSSADTSEIDNRIMTFIHEPQPSYFETIDPINKIVTRQSKTRLNDANVELYGGEDGYVEMSLMKPHRGAIIEWFLDKENYPYLDEVTSYGKPKKKYNGFVYIRDLSATSIRTPNIYEVKSLRWRHYDDKSDNE